MQNTKKKNIYQHLTSVTFISSEECNLHCSYCELAKNASNKCNTENEKIKQSFLSGDYVTKYQRVFYEYNINEKAIDRIDLWGQEPTLTLNEFTTQLNRILNWLCNCNFLFFSTNGIDYIENILNLIKELNQYIEQNPRNFTLRIQFSLDELNYMEKQRGIDPNIVINNIKKLITNLNNINLNQNLTISIIFHGVITLELIHDVLEKNSIEQFWIDIDNIINDFTILNINKQVKISPLWGSTIQHPYNATQQEGRELTEFIQKSLLLYNNFKRSSLNPQRILDMYAKWQSRSIETVFKMHENILDMYNFEYDRICDNGFIGSNLGCSVGTNDIKMRYDGTLLYCQSLIFSLNEQNLNTFNNDITYDFQKLQLKYNYSPNLLTSPYEDIVKFTERFNVRYNYSYNFIITNIINLMYILLKNHQIDESYKDPEKMLRHAIYLVRISQCWYDHISETGSMHGRTFGTIRLYCNGFLDLIEQYLKSETEKDLW